MRVVPRLGRREELLEEVRVLGLPDVERELGVRQQRAGPAAERHVLEQAERRPRPHGDARTRRLGARRGGHAVEGALQGRNLRVALVVLAVVEVRAAGRRGAERGAGCAACRGWQQRRGRRDGDEERERSHACCRDACDSCVACDHCLRRLLPALTATRASHRDSISGGFNDPLDSLEDDLTTRSPKLALPRPTSTTRRKRGV